MRRRFVILTLVLVLGAASFAQKPPKKSNFPQLIVAARFVYVTSVLGDQFNPRLLAEDRQVLANVDEALRKWGRYRIVNRPEDADITLLLRRGDMAWTGGIGGVGVPRGSVGIGGYETAQAGSPDDFLVVVRGGQDPLDAPSLWRRSRRNGLQAPVLTLFQEFKKEVERADAASKNP